MENFKQSFTMAERRSSRFLTLGHALAFTMAEILISLTIIGIIAAITLPALQANINEKTWATQRKALYSRMSQAISLMPSLNGYGVVMGENGVDEAATANRATQAFISDGLSKVLKINNICAAPNGADAAVAREAFKKCGFPEKIVKHGKNAPKIDTPTKLTDLNGYFSYADYSQINTIAAAFETANGESILTFYNPNCSYTYGVNGANSQQNLMQPTMCANFVYDLNGKKGPNKVGNDIGFMTAFYPSDTELVAPMPAGHLQVNKDKPYSTFTIGNGNASCRKQFGDDAKMANIEELKSVFVNNKLGRTINGHLLFLSGDGYGSSTYYSSTKIYSLSGYSGQVYIDNISYNTGNYKRIFCVKK